jgi:hypothetical protein
MTKDMTSAVLTDEVAQVCAKAHIRCCTLLKIPLLYRKSSKKEESFAIDQILTERFQPPVQIRQREIGLWTC